MQTHTTFFTILILIVLAFFTINLSAQPQRVSEDIIHIPVEAIDQDIERINAPPGIITNIQFEQSTYDFGEITEGEIVTHVFTFTNTGKEPLVLSNARGSCGCTVPQWPREPIAPGETASITVEFNSKNKKGKRNQKVTITANTNPPQTFIYLTGEVAPQDENEITISSIKKETKEEETESNCFMIFPNPTAEILKLEVAEDKLGQPTMISIYSKGGQLMAKREIKSVESITEFSVSHYPAGTYIANVQVGERKPEVHCFVVVD